jgi:hypothetical protein
MLNELLPKSLKLSFNEYNAQSNAVKMPTNAMIPMAIIAIVNPDRSKLERTDVQATDNISENFICNYLLIIKKQ